MFYGVTLRQWGDKDSYMYHISSTKLGFWARQKDSVTCGKGIYGMEGPGKACSMV